MTAAPSGAPVEQPIWFGPSDRPLCGWLTLPASGLASQGVLFAPPVGREARAARRAFRLAARRMARRDIASIRFDYDGTGDSSGFLDDPDRDAAWIESVALAVETLRRLDVPAVSAIGMRLGATVLGATADARDLGLASLVLWDPCASGRNYLRELSALESLRRENVGVGPDGSIETSEYVFSIQTANEIRRLSLTTLDRSPLADRLLVITRDDRSIPDKLRERLSKERVTWSQTSEQRQLIDTDPLHATMPETTIDEIIDWLGVDESTPVPIRALPARDVVFTDRPGARPIRERFVELGDGRLFGIVTEPTTTHAGPLMIFLNVSTDEHTGPSRLWVELSRRWASLGLQSVRFDLTGIGDSPMLDDEGSAHIYDQAWLEDLGDVARALRPEHASDSVYLGLCSGAFLAVEAGLQMRAVGVCIINPPVGIDFLHGSTRLASSRHSLPRAMGAEFKEIALRIRWVSVVLWHVCRVLMPTVFSIDVMSRLAHSETDLLVLASSEDLSPYPKTHRFDRFFSSRLVAPKGYEVTFVPGLDHSMLAAVGRARTIELLDRHVVDRYATATGAADLGAGDKERT